jgi:hypothetical protein
MKKITLVLAFIGMITLNSCTVNETPAPVQQINNTFISELFEVTTSFGPNNNYSRLVTFNPPIYNTDMVLVYHLYDVVNGSDVWRLMPQTYYLDLGALDYNYDFTKYDVNLFLDADFNLDYLTPAWSQNQTFRIVVIPADFTNKSAVDYKDYNATIKMLGYENAPIKKINVDK